MPRNVTIASRARMLPRGEDAVVREQLNLFTLKMGEICDMLDADGGVAAATYAATIADATDSPSLVGSIGAQYVPGAGGAVGVAVALAFLSMPSAVNENATLAAVQVEARTATGERATDFVGPVTVTLQSVAYVSGTVRDVVLRASAPGLATADSGTLRVTLA